MLAAARDKGTAAVDEALDKLAEKLAISLASNPNITPARRDEAFDELFTYGANRAGIQIDP